MTDDRARLVWSPTRESIASARITDFVSWLGHERGLTFPPDDYDALWRWSVDELEDFWDAVWHFFEVIAHRPYDRVLDERRMPGARWFEGAELNYAENVLARAARAGGSLICVDESGGRRDVSAAELEGQVGALAESLARFGVGRGDRVAAYLPNIPEAVVAMLAVTSLGATWAACAPDFGTKSVLDRFAQIEPKVLLAVDGYTFGGRRIDRREVVARLQAGLPGLERTVLVRASESAARALGAERYEQLVARPRRPAFVAVPFDHPLWILFSSGTTGIPKGIVHSHGGIVVEHLKALGLGLNLGPDDTYLFFSSTSWMAWNYLVAGLMHGADVVLYDGSPSHPETDALWTTAAAVGATVLGTGSAYVSGCQKAGVELDAGSLASLRTIIPTGSPLPPAGWSWLTEQLPATTRIDSVCGGTDVCTVFFGGSQVLPVRAGEISARWPGVRAEAWDDEGRPLTGEVGEFVVTAPMPSMPTMFWNDPDGSRLRASYFDVFPGVWRQGDWIAIHSDGAVQVFGRSDATLNKSGVRLGSAEMYAVVERLPEVLDSLVVGIEEPDGGYYMPLFVVTAAADDEIDELRDRVIAAIRAELSPRYVPSEIVVVPALPRTLTGKKLEIPVKRVLQGLEPEQAVALGSIDSPDALAWFADYARARA